MPCAYGTQRTTALRIRHQVSRRAAQRSQLLQNLTILIVKSRSVLNAPPSLQVRSGASENALAESEVETAKPRPEGDVQHDAWYWRRARSHPPPGCLWLLWQSASTLTEPFRPDGNVFCWCPTRSHRASQWWFLPLQLWLLPDRPNIGSCGEQISS